MITNWSNVYCAQAQKYLEEIWSGATIPEIWNLKGWFHESEILCENLFTPNTDGWAWMILLNSLTFFASSRTVLLTSEAISSREERIQRNYSCATIRISHKQLFAKNFAGMESGLMESLYSRFFVREPMYKK